MKTLNTVLAAVVLLTASGVFAHASKEKFERTKPHVNIGTIGHVDHGTQAPASDLKK